MKKILLIGSGAREHAIAEAVKRSVLVCFGNSRNPGITALTAAYATGDLGDLSALRDFASANRPDFAIIGPENPIALGAADMLQALGIPTVAPLRAAAQLESSKSFSRELLEKHGIAGNPRFRVFTETDGIREYLEELGDEFVIKADGLRGGKGVKVSGDHLADIAEGVQYAEECLSVDGKVVIEEKLIGHEFSLMSFSDGRTIVDMPAVQDHKRAYDGDLGPNTGGMGSYSCPNHLLPFLREEDVQKAHEINAAVAEAVLKETGVPFRGILYGGFMATRSGIRLIEYNVRFGDPESMNVLPILKTDFVAVCEAILSGTLADLRVEFEAKATVCKYVVPEGYPDHPLRDEKIEIADVPKGVRVFYASVNERDGALFLAGSRAVAFTGIADTLSEAEKLAEAGARSVRGRVFHRSDIGTK
ncbi:phosphoribosylamine--glycine ligase [Candidatus Peregrinibacteria bacterium]|nr:phosphoribosylamine--glycine ligase [Candidatus Peregrinibacteria bacterium]